MNNTTGKKVIAAFEHFYGHAPEVVTRAPGRVEILGNHTDYNEGVVLSAAVDRATYVAAGRRQGRKCCVHCTTTDSSATFNLDHLENPEKGAWVNYIKGLVVELQKRGKDVPAFEAALGSTVPIYAGMSSSAALEMSVAYALSVIADVDLPWQEWAKVGQSCENHYVGAQTGLLDQFSSIKGRRGQLVFSDFRTLGVRNVPLPAGTSMVIANSMVKHTLTNEYNERRQCCEAAVEFLQKHFDGISALRDVTREQLESVKDEMESTTFKRAYHVVGENERVNAGVEALRKGDVGTFGGLMFESHHSSREYFENSSPELDVLVDIAHELPGRLGARLSGGGFGGITVHLVEETQAQEYSLALGEQFAQRTGLESQIMICFADDGAEVLQRDNGS